MYYKLQSTEIILTKYKISSNLKYKLSAYIVESVYKKKTSNLYQKCFTIKIQ